MKSHVYWAIVVTIVSLAVFFRFYGLGRIPVSVYWDEAAILVDAKAISETGMDIHGHSWIQAIFPSYGDYKLPVLIWLAAISVKIFGATAFALRLPSALFGIFSLGIVVLIARTLAEYIFLQQLASERKKIITITSALVMATSFWSILFSRTAFEGHVGQALLAASVYLALQAKNKRWFYIISAIVGALAVYTYYSIRFVWPVVFIFAALIPFLVQLQSIKEVYSKVTHNFKTILVWGSWIACSYLIFFLLMQPMLSSPYYEASQQYRLSATSILQREPQILESNKLRELAGNSSIDRIFFHRDLLTIQLLAEHYAEHLSLNYLFITGDQNLRHGTQQHGLFPFIMVIPFCIGLYRLARKRVSILLFLITWWLVSLLPASVPYDVPHALRSLNALMPITIIISFGLYSFFNWTSTVQKFTTALFCVVLAFQVVQFWQYYTTAYPQRSAAAWQAGYSEVAQKLVQEAPHYDEVWYAYPEDKFFIWVALQPGYLVKIQNMSKVNFKIFTLDTISFQSYNFQSIQNPHHSVLVINRADILEKELMERGLHQQKIEYVTDSTGTQKYMFATFKSEK